MNWTLSIDFGTSSTIAVAARDDGGREVIEIDGERRMPSVAFLDDDETWVVGRSAVDLSSSRPGRAVRVPKRRLGEQTPIVVGGRPFQAVAVAAEILRFAADRARRHMGSDPRAVRLTFPATWNRPRRTRLLEAAEKAGLPTPTLIPEPVAAAHALPIEVPNGSHVAIYDLGGGTFDTTVVRASGGGFEVVGRPTGDSAFGGELFDEIIRNHIGEQLTPDVWDELQVSDELPWRQASARLLAECKRVKEALSSHPYGVAVVSAPIGMSEVRLSRDELEELVAPFVDESVDVLGRAIEQAGITPNDLAVIHLVGGASRMPIVSERVKAAFPGVRVEQLGDPRTAAALGAPLADPGDTQVEESASAERSTADNAAPPAPPAQPVRPPSRDAGLPTSRDAGLPTSRDAGLPPSHDTAAPPSHDVAAPPPTIVPPMPGGPPTNVPDRGTAPPPRLAPAATLGLTSTADAAKPSTAPAHVPRPTPAPVEPSGSGSSRGILIGVLAGLALLGLIGGAIYLNGRGDTSTTASTTSTPAQTTTSAPDETTGGDSTTTVADSTTTTTSATTTTGETTTTSDAGTPAEPGGPTRSDAREALLRSTDFDSLEWASVDPLPLPSPTCGSNVAIAGPILTEFIGWSREVETDGSTVSNRLESEIVVLGSEEVAAAEMLREQEVSRNCETQEGVVGPDGQSYDITILSIDDDDFVIAPNGQESFTIGRIYRNNSTAEFTYMIGNRIRVGRSIHTIWIRSSEPINNDELNILQSVTLDVVARMATLPE